MKKTLKLMSPVQLHGAMISEISFREPRGGEFLDLGEPRVITRTKDDSIFLIENDAAIKAYVQSCVEGNDGPVVLQLLSLADMRAAKELVLSFFTDADAANLKTN